MRQERSKGQAGVWMLTLAAAVVAGAAGFWHGQTRAEQPVTVAPVTLTPAALGKVEAKGDPAKDDPSVAKVDAASPIEAGRYLVKVGGCNDCHTPGGHTGQEIPEAQWLTGTSAGYRGPWGTTYPPNLRLFVSTMSEDDFVKIVRARNSRPPMPWASLHAMSDADLRALYQYIKSLGAAGTQAPQYVPPGEEPTAPYVSLEPVFPREKK